MTGLSRRTGQPIDNLTDTLQSVEVILSTRLASRVMRREFGGGVAELLGRAMTASLFAAWQQLIGTAIDLWEPRLVVRSVELTGTTANLKAGRAGLKISADYRPNAHLATDDPSYSTAVDSTVSFAVSAFSSGTVSTSL